MKNLKLPNALKRWASTLLLLCCVISISIAQEAIVKSPSAIKYVMTFRSNSVPTIQSSADGITWTTCSEKPTQASTGIYTFTSINSYKCLKFIGDITSLGVSNNYEVNAVDVTKCPNLTKLYVSRTNITSLNLWYNPKLEIITANYTKLTELDFSVNHLLISVECAYSNLNSVYFGHFIPNFLTHFVCEHNAISIASMPRMVSPKEYWNAYQKPITIPNLYKNTALVNQKIDLRLQARSCNVQQVWQSTVFTWYATGVSTPLVRNVDYVEIEEGLFAFIKTFSSVYCKMTNPVYPAYTNPCTSSGSTNFTCGTNTPIWTTTPIAISNNVPKVEMTFGSSGSGTTIYAKTVSGDAPVFVDMYNNSSNGTPDMSGYIINAGGKLIVIGELEDLYAQGKSDECKMQNISFTGINTLKDLVITNHEITSINVSNQPNLDDLIINKNKLTTLDVTNNTKIVELQCANNSLSTIVHGSMPNLKTLICASNNISVLDFNNAPNLEHIYCQVNKINTLNTGSNTKLIGLDCSYNNLTFNSLIYTSPLPNSKLNPQYTIFIPAQNTGMINLNTIGATNYVWKKQDGTILKNDATSSQDGDYRESNGVFYFHKPFTNIYCEMTNPNHSDMLLITSSTSNTTTLKSSQETDLTTVAENEVAATTVAVRPNPAQNSISVSGLDGASLQIVSYTGMVVRDIANYDGGSIDISSLTVGLYTVVSGGTEVRFVKE